MIEFRKYTPSDLDAVVEIFRSNIPKYFTAPEEDGLRGFLKEYSEDYFVGEIDGEIVAAGGIAQNEDESISLCWGMVRNDQIGTGLGKALTAYRLELAKENFPGKPMVVSTSQHTSGFYEKLGFEMTRHVVDGFSPGIDTCEMRRP
jgi:[ribosomal protein S18]-alanine N-acetyltransferase